jgi:transcriptional regulator with XRE-family HTH domain
LFIISNKMRSKKPVLLPTTSRIMKVLGENIKLARRRRGLNTEQVSERANISRSTLWLIEKGDPGVAMGTYLQVLFVLGLEKDMLQIAADDEYGRKLQDVALIRKEK